MAFLPPVPPVSAQNHAQSIYREQGITLRNEGYEYCLLHVRGEPILAREVARFTVDVQEACKAQWAPTPDEHSHLY